MSRMKNGKAAMKTVLFNLQLQQYLPAFQKHNIDLKTFVTMNEQTLQSIGVLNETHRRILIMCIRKLSQLLITTAAANSIEELDEHLLTPIAEEAPVQQNVILSDDVDYQSPDFMILDNKSDKSLPIIPDSPPAYTVEPPEMSVLSQITSLNSNNIKPNNHSLSRRLSLSIRIGGTNEDEDSNRRHSMPALPSYLDAVKGQKSEMPVNLGERECEEELPSYSCTVNRTGYLIKKDETKANGQKAYDRSWRKFYMQLWGTFVRIYKSEPLDINHVSPVLQFSMDKAIVGLAVDYTKRRNVFRIQLPTGHTYLFQAVNRADCISWIEKLQSSANISSTIDDREMPMFITLPIRRRRRATMPPTSSETNRDQVLFMTVTSSGLTYEHFNDIARELQQVQITEALPQRQLSW